LKRKEVNHLGKNDSILGAIGGLISAMAGEVDIIGPSISSSSSPSSPSTSGSGSHSDSHGGGDGSSSTDWLGITERTNAQGKTVNQIVRVGNKDHIYPAGYTGFIDALLGGKPVAVSEFNGDRINHQDANGKTVATSIIRSDGRIDSWGSDGQFLGSKTPTFSANQASQTITPSLSQSEASLDWSEYDDDESAGYWHALLENDIDDLNRVVNNCYTAEQSGDKEKLESSKWQLGSDCVRLIRIAENTEQLLRIKAILDTPAHIQGYLEGLNTARKW